VSTHGKAAAHDTSCRSAAYASIAAGVSAVAPHGTVVVCGGTYREDVVVAKPVSLVGRPGTVINAAGKINGILVKAARVKVSGFTLTGAIGEGILVNSANHVSIEGNVVTSNDLAVYDNTVEGNSISGNGMSGVSVHSHVPGQFLNGNVIAHNVIGVNNIVGDSDFAPHVDTQTTAVLVGTVSPLSIEVFGNVIADDHFGIWTTGPATVHEEHDNSFAGDIVPVTRG
jgi:nitrous oxidase accessory protein NosD